MEHTPTHYNTDWKKFSGYPKEVETKEIKDIKQMTIEELFGTLQMSVVSGWRKHLRSAKYGKHQAMGEFYEEMPDKVDALIEAWMGAHGKKVGNFVNVISSANLNTLSYLKELKQVCKSGYSLMNDNEELKSLLDDIVNLINSTLYKVKELSESRMIDLKDFIMEKLNENPINESVNDYIFTWNHYDPDTIYCLNGNINKIPMFLKNYDWQYQDVKIPTKLCSVAWNDEMAIIMPVDGNNLNDAKKIDLKSIQAQLDSYKDQIEEEDYAYVESNLFGGANEWDGASKMSAQDFLDEFISIIKDSYVDGDSNYARAVIDIKKGETLLQGSCHVTFMSANEFMEMVESGDE